jgi:hypothetical protein
MNMNNQCDNISELKDQINDQQMKLWFDKMLDDLVEQNMLQIINIETNKEQIINQIMATIPKSRKISIALSDDTIAHVSNEVAVYSPVIKEYLECKRDVLQPLKLNVTSKAINLLSDMLLNKQTLEEYYKIINFMTDDLNYETSYLINYLMIGQSDVTDKVKIACYMDSYRTGHRQYISCIRTALIFELNDTEYNIKINPVYFYKDSGSNNPYKASKFEFCYKNHADREMFCEISEKSFNNSADVADRKFNQSFKTLITYEYDKNLWNCDIAQMKQYYAYLLQDLMKNNCAKLCFDLRINLLILCKMILCFNRYKYEP